MEKDCKNCFRESSILKSFFLMMCLSFFVSMTLAQKKTIIEGFIKDQTNNTAHLTLCKYINITENDELVNPVSHSKFKFVFDLKDPGYFIININDTDSPLLLIEPGDSIHITIDKKFPNGAIFSGKGSGKLTFLLNAGVKFNGWFKPEKRPNISKYTSFSNYLDSCRNVQIKFLDTYKHNLSPVAYRTLWADIFYDTEYHRTLFLLHLISPQTNADLNKLYNTYSSNRKNFKISDTLAYSRSYLSYLYNVNQLDFNRLCYNSPDVKFNFEGLYNLAKKNYTGKTKERILANMLLNQLLFNPTDAISCENDYLTGNYDTGFKQVVYNKYDFQKKFMPGNNEINFKLPDTADQLVSLDEFKGKVVFLDFWFNGCVGCASSFQAMQKVTNYFKNNNSVVFLNVSVDKSKNRWIDGINLYHISNDINLYTEGKGDIHQTIKLYGISGYPAQFLIDQNGKYITGKPPRPDKDDGKALISLIENSLKNQ